MDFRQSPRNPVSDPFVVKMRLNQSKRLDGDRHSWTEKPGF